MRTAEDTATGQAGTGAVASAETLRDTVTSGGWVAPGLSEGGGMAALSATMRPTDAIAEAGLDWLVPKVQPLQDVLDRLAGNASVIQTFADAWQRASPAVEQVGQQLTRTSSASAGQWQGAAADNYRGRAAEIAESLRGSAMTFSALGAAATRMGEAAAGARTQVNDLVTDLVNRLVSYVGQATAAEGGVTSNVMSQATSMINSYTGPIADIENKLTRTVDNLEPLLTGDNATGDTRGITKDGTQLALLHLDQRDPLRRQQRILGPGGGGGGGGGISFQFIVDWLRKLLRGESKAIPPATPPVQQPGDTPTDTPPGTPSTPGTPPATPPTQQPGTPPVSQPGTPETAPPPGDTPPNQQPAESPVQEPGTPPRQQPATPPSVPPADTPPAQQPSTPPTPQPGTPESTPPRTPQQDDPPLMGDPPSDDKPAPQPETPQPAPDSQQQTTQPREWEWPEEPSAEERARQEEEAWRANQEAERREADQALPPPAPTHPGEDRLQYTYDSPHAAIGQEVVGKDLVEVGRDKAEEWFKKDGFEKVYLKEKGTEDDPDAPQWSVHHNRTTGEYGVGKSSTSSSDFEWQQEWLRRNEMDNGE